MKIRLTEIIGCSGLKTPEAWPGYYVYNPLYYTRNKLPKKNILKKEKEFGKGEKIDIYG